MSRIFCIPGIVILFVAFVLSFIVSISLPFLPAVEITRTTFGGDKGSAGVRELRLGVWSFCEYDAQTEARTCSAAEHAYSVTVRSPSDDASAVTIGSSWTRGLAIHPVGTSSHPPFDTTQLITLHILYFISLLLSLSLLPVQLATACIFIAFLLSFSTHITVTLVSSLIAFISALITLIAFAVDIALLVYVKRKMSHLEGLDESNGEKTRAGAGFWLTFLTFILLLLAACTVCLGRRRDRMVGATTTTTVSSKENVPFWKRFRKNRQVL